MARLANFLKRPRNYAIVAVTGTTLMFGYKAAPHLLPDYVYRPIFEAYKSGKPYRLTETQNREFLEVCKDLQVSPEKFRTFVTSRWEAKSVGLPWFPARCHVGVPASLTAEPDLQNLRFSGPIRENLDTREGMWLREALEMSHHARKFAVAQQVAFATSNFPLYSMVLAPTFTLAGFATTFVVQTLSPVAPIYVTALGVYACFYFLYSFSMGAVNERIDLRVNQRLANLNEDYTMGGLEFYEKVLQKNRALRKLMGSKGEKLYTYYGNETPGLVYTSGASNIQKRDILKAMVEKMEKERRAKEKLESAS